MGSKTDISWAIIAERLRSITHRPVACNQLNLGQFVFFICNFYPKLARSLQTLDIAEIMYDITLTSSCDIL